ncbi:MAG: MFS transporter [Chloroflexi bacterium]|nr:MAG: MFS transporter [Chloroflexota bacterium]
MRRMGNDVILWLARTRSYPSISHLMASSASLWHQREFMKLWTGQTISEFGSRITRDGLSLAALLSLGASPTQLGLLAAIAMAPTIVFSLIAGAWVDRLRRRPIMIASDVARALTLATIPLAALAGVLTLPLLALVAAVAGVLTVLFDTAYHSYLPSLVEREHILEGNSKLTLSSATAEVLGPGVAGALIQALTAPIAIFFDACSFLVSALSIWLIRKPEPALNPSTERQHIAREIHEGLRTVARDPRLRNTALAASTLALFGSFYSALYGVYAIRVLGMGPALLGLVVGVGGVGSLVAERVVQRAGLGTTFISMLLLMGVTGLFTPLAPGPLWLATAFLSLSQLGDAFRTIYFINDVSLRQAITPDRLLGRVNASTALLVSGAGPLGAVLGGALGDNVGVRNTLFIASAGPFLACLWLLFSPVRRLREQPGA